MKYFKKIGEVDVGPINKQLEDIPHFWDLFKTRTDFVGSPHEGISDLWVRFNAWKNFDPENPSEFIGPHESEFYGCWYYLTELHDLVFDAMRAVRATRLGGVIITEIKPGQRIAPHADTTWHPQKYDTKIYIILETNDQVVFRVMDEQVVMKQGEVWIVENRVEHEIWNSGNSRRRTLIICTETK